MEEEEPDVVHCGGGGGEEGAFFEEFARGACEDGFTGLDFTAEAVI